MKKNFKLIVINGTEMLDILNIATVVAVFDMGRLDDKFPFEIFTEPLYYTLIQLGNGEHPTKTDANGEVMKTASVHQVLNALEKLMAGGCEYRRLYPCAAMLRAFMEKSSEWDRLRVACYYY